MICSFDIYRYCTQIQIVKTKYVHIAGHLIIFCLSFKVWDTLGDVWETLEALENFLNVIVENETMKPWLSKQNQFLCSSASQNLNMWYLSFWYHFKDTSFSIPLFFSNFLFIYWNDRGHTSHLQLDDVQIQCKVHISHFSEKCFFKIYLPNCPDSSPVSPRVGLLVWAASCTGKVWWTDNNPQLPSSLQHLGDWGTTKELERKEWDLPRDER